jgi:serine protease inhibitor
MRTDDKISKDSKRANLFRLTVFGAAVATACLCVMQFSWALEAAPANQRGVVLDTPNSPLSKPEPAVTQTTAVDTALSNQGSLLAPDWVSKLGLSMLVGPGEVGKPAPEAVNRVASPVSLMSALGLVHAGTAGPSANEISDLLAPSSARATAFQKDIPLLLKQLMDGNDALTSANRLWLDTSLGKSINPAYQEMATTRFRADAALVSFQDGAGKNATDTINRWASIHTNDRIKVLLPDGAVDARTQAVLTNALRFKSPWAVVFDPKFTQPKTFMGMAALVPTMRKSMEVGVSLIRGVTVYELDFQSPAFSFRVALNDKGDAPAAAAVLLSGSAEGAAFVRKTCAVELPKFRIDPQSVSLKNWLQAQKVSTAFSDQADFSPLLGTESKQLALKLSDVFHSAGIEVDESGVEAVAATAAVITTRSVFASPTDVCAVDRPFAFAIVHKPSGTPVFIGQVFKP